MNINKESLRDLAEKEMDAKTKPTVCLILAK